MTMFFPSTYPSSRRPCRNASTRAKVAEEEVPDRYPIRGTFFGCCALTTGPHRASVTMRATIPAKFRFWILRRCSVQVLDFRLKTIFLTPYASPLTELLCLPDTAPTVES